MTPTVALAAGFLALIALLSFAFKVVVGRRRRGSADRSIRDLGTVSQQWLIVHRSEWL